MFKNALLKTFIMLFVMSLSVSSQAGFLDDLKNTLRPHLIKILGKETATKFLGKDPNEITLPEIPKVGKNAKDISNYGKGPKNKVAYEKDQERRFNYNFVKELYKATRKVEASDNEISRWMNVLEQNGSREGVYRALVLDGTYLGLENYEFPMEETTVDFTMTYIEKYLNKTISETNLKKANFYTVKRDITEKTLEVVDEFLKMEGDEVYDWYALFSAEMAKKFPAAMDNETRKETSPQKHKLWAKSVPDQYLKSEVIIKLHKVFNSIQG